MMTKKRFKTVFQACACFILIVLLVVVIISYQISDDDIDLRKTEENVVINEIKSDKSTILLDEVTDPIILWWTPLTQEKGQVKTCGGVKCFFTVDRQYKNHPMTKVFVFYASDIVLTDIPLPRQPHHEWALLHEESPKNVYLFSHQEAMEQFNHTSTFKRQSDYPISTLYLKSIRELEDDTYVVPTKEKNKLLSELALVNYVQSDCGTASDRDAFVTMLQRHIKVDSYGECNHNKDLPIDLREPLKGMDDVKFYRILAKYKFTLALENGVCDDYITEKFWRPFKVGSIPIVFGSSKIKDFLPSETSAIVVNDFETMDDLVRFLLHLNNSDREYDQYLQYKRTGVTNEFLKGTLRTREWGVDDWNMPNFIDGFECFLCKRLHDNRERKAAGEKQTRYQATIEHYGCPKPKKFKDHPPGNLKRVNNNWWASEWIDSKYQAMAWKEFIQKGLKFTNSEFLSRADSIRKSLHQHR